LLFQALFLQRRPNAQLSNTLLLLLLLLLLLPSGCCRGCSRCRKNDI
jgi:hypothetical protein